MGIPYSKQINAAFDQVTPLVASAYEVLETTKNIAILLAVIQLCTVALLVLILLALIGLLFTMNPDLQTERRAIVTPVMQSLARWILDASGRSKSLGSILIGLVALSAGLVVYAGIYYTRKDSALVGTEEDSTENKEVALKDGSRTGKKSDVTKKEDTKN